MREKKNCQTQGEGRGLRARRCTVGENIWRQEDRHVSFRLKLKSFMGLTNCKKMSEDVKETIIMFHLCCEVSAPGTRAGVRVHVSVWFTWTETVWHQKILQTKCVKKQNKTTQKKKNDDNSSAKVIELMSRMLTAILVEPLEPGHRFHTTNIPALFCHLLFVS